MSKYVIALYIRLSIEDIKVESMSIESQKVLLHKYAENLVEDAEIVEYVDNGHSGTNFERPAVQELLNEVQNHRINCIMVKDFSRFGRNSIEVGYFTQQVFPLYKVRFISVADCFDSDEHKGDTGGMEVAFKYLVNEYYSRDLSTKTKTAKYTKMRRGEYNAGHYPYGYLPDKDGRPVIDESVADVVRMIFDLTINGASAMEISKILFEKNIPTPAQHRAERGKTGYLRPNAKYWQRSAIVQMLQNEIYMGMFVMCKKTVSDVGSHKMLRRDESEWIKIPNHYPAIVSEETFKKANEIRRKAPRPPKTKDREYPLRKKVYCGCCKHAMKYRGTKNAAYLCLYTKIDDTEPCHNLEIKTDELQKKLFDIICKQAENVNIGGTSSIPSMENLSVLEDNIALCQQKKQELYEQFILQNISADEFQKQKNKCNADIQMYEQQIKISQTAAEQVRLSNASVAGLTNIIKEIQKATTLTKSIEDTLVEKVFVYPDKHIEVEWKIDRFGNEK